MQEQTHISSATKHCPKCNFETESWANICEKYEYEWPDKFTTQIKPLSFQKLILCILFSVIGILLITIIPAKYFTFILLSSYLIFYSDITYKNHRIPKKFNFSRTTTIIGAIILTVIISAIFISYKIKPKDIADKYCLDIFRTVFVLLGLSHIFEGIKLFRNPINS